MEGEMILCLDVSTVAVGFAVADTTTGKIVHHGAVKSTRPKLHERLHDLCCKLCEEVIDNKRGDYEYAVLEEGLFCRAHAGTFSLGAAQGAVMHELQCDDIPIEYLKISHWKQVLTGYGNANKQLVQATVKALGHGDCTEDEADAIGVAYGALEIIEAERLEKRQKTARKIVERDARREEKKKARRKL
jgi:Holliday junction resolvasome RuvABC endonuclease subunit